MSEPDAPRPRCPHCDAELSLFEMPEESGYEQAKRYQWACFNDDCPYYRNGWDWMYEHYEVRASYRYRLVTKNTDQCTPLPVWSPTAVKDRIVDPATVTEEDRSA